jgi:hypothetical protein
MNTQVALLVKKAKASVHLNSSPAELDSDQVAKVLNARGILDRIPGNSMNVVMHPARTSADKAVGHLATLIQAAGHSPEIGGAIVKGVENLGHKVHQEGSKMFKKEVKEVVKPKLSLRNKALLAVGALGVGGTGAYAFSKRDRNQY